MHDHDEDNDGRYPDESPVEVRYPRSKQEEQGDREQWPWLPGTIVEQCGPDEWYVCIEVRELAVLRDGRRAPRGTASRNLYYPCCFRDRSEIRPRTASSGAASATRPGALFARDAQMTLTGAPARLRPLPRLLLRTEVPVSGSAAGAALLACWRQRPGVARVAAAAAAATFAVHAVREAIYLSPGHGSEEPAAQ